jgi:hypothetical protein
MLSSRHSVNTTTKRLTMLGKVVLWFSAIIFISYGLVCLVSPDVPAGYAGLGINTGDAFVEIGAMYGGLQTGFGLFCLLGALRSNLYRPALTATVLIVGGLALGRFYSLLTGTDQVGVYTYGAITFEFITTILAGLALKKP